jgi:hypothetical protein
MVDGQESPTTAIDHRLSTTVRKLRTWLPWALIIAADGIAVWRGYLAAWWYRRWLHTRVFDPSGAELDYASARSETSLALLALGVAAIGVALVLLGQRRQRRAAAKAESSDAVRPA